MNVLLVDDDPVCNLLNRKILERTGVVTEIHTALNGAEAISLFNQYFQGSLAVPDVVLLDLNMPIMDGFNFIEAFKKLPFPKENVRIVIVTSSIHPRDISRAKEMGIKHYLSKPMTEEKLMSALQDPVSV